MATERLIIAQDLPLFSPLHLFIFGATILVYNTHYLVKRSVPGVSDRFSWTERYRYWHFLMVGLGLLSCLFALPMLPITILLWAVFTAVLSFSYSLPWLPVGGGKPIREFGFIKILVLTGVWTIVTAVFPIIYWGQSLLQYPVEIILRLLFMFTLCVAFDIRDAQTDIQAKIYTLPNLIGIRNSYRLMDFTLFLFLVFSTVQYLRYPDSGRLVGELLAAAITRMAISYTRKYPSDRNYLLIIDGMMLVYAALLLWL
jgi:4-hydroxybenzoate polyprenyltransferase